MTSEEFVEAIRRAVRDSSIQSTIKNLEQPPGRRPQQEDIELSAWYHQMSDQDRQHTHKVIAEAVDYAVFGFFCVIDGVRVIEPIGPKSDFRLNQHAPDGTITCLNPENGEFLHDLYNARD